uniref:MAK10-like protein n=1 Tax=Tanacetum cinerariifolium TaxID=118510 RepID=A0A6L2LZY3_TANCI|nr:MAK10-like protein [Tanacetum cinerariifolium]
MGDENPICTFRDYFKPSYEGYKNTIELLKRNNVVPLRSDTIRLVQNGCSFHRLRSEDPNQHLKDFLKLVDSLDLDVAKGKNAPAMDSFQGLTPKSPSSWLQIQIFYDHVFFHIKCEINCAAGNKLRNKNADESWEIIKNLAYYDHEGWNDSKYFFKLVKAISTSQSTSKTLDRRLLEIEGQTNFLLTGSHSTPRSSLTHIPQACVEAQEEINDKMIEIFRIFKKLTASRAPKKVLIREEARHPVTKNINSISLIRGEEEKDANDEATFGDSIERPDGSNAEVPSNEVKKENEAENETKNKPIKRAEKELTQVKEEELVEALNSQPVGGPNFKAMLKKKITKKEDIGGNFEIPCNIGDIRLSLANHLYIYTLEIAEDTLVDVARYVYPIDFMILDIKDDEKRPFILGTPFLTTATAVIKFDKGTINLRSGKSKMSFHRIPESLCRIKK